MTPTQDEAPAGDWAQSVTLAIVRLMEARGMSGRSLARETGMTNTYVARRLRMDSTFNLNDIERIGQALDFAPSSFLVAICLSHDPDQTQRRTRSAVQED